MENEMVTLTLETYEKTKQDLSMLEMLKEHPEVIITKKNSFSIFGSEYLIGFEYLGKDDVLLEMQEAFNNLKEDKDVLEKKLKKLSNRKLTLTERLTGRIINE